MPSGALVNWRTIRVGQLDEMEKAHRKIGGALPGRRYATRQINHAYAMLLSSQFQGYCRDLHSECVQRLFSPVEVPGVPPGNLRRILLEEFLSGRKLESGNPNPGNLGSDFNRLGVEFWASVKAYDPTRADTFKRLLVELNVWRNAIAHQDFKTVPVDNRTIDTTGYLLLTRVREWRGACAGLAEDFDAVMAAHLASLIGSTPW